MTSTQNEIPPTTQAAVLSPDILTVQTSVCSGSQPSFLALPAELRNAICAYALSATSPLLYRPSSQPNIRGTFYEASQTRQFNQLKHVNRQLRAETEDLEIKYSEITFGHNLYARNHPAGQSPELLSFADLLPAPKLQWLTNVTLKPLPRWFGIMRNLQAMFKAWELFATYFRDRPQISIKYFLPCFTPAYGMDELKDAYPGRFIKVGMILVEVVRGYDYSYLKNTALEPRSRHKTVNRQLQKHQARELEKRLPNFRIFPYQDEPNALWIRNALNDMPQVVGSANLLQHWILVATEWIEKGI